MMRHDGIDPAIVRESPEGAGRRVADCMSAPVVAVRADEAATAAWAVMRTHHVRHVPVLDEAERLIGIVTDRSLRELAFDLWRADAPAPADLHAIPVASIMAVDVVTVRPDLELSAAARLMRERRVGALPVIDGLRLVGILTKTDLVRGLVDVAA